MALLSAVVVVVVVVVVQHRKQTKVSAAFAYLCPPHLSALQPRRLQ